MHSVEYVEYISLSQNRHKFIQNTFDVNQSQRPSMGVFHEIGSIFHAFPHFVPRSLRNFAFAFAQ